MRLCPMCAEEIQPAAKICKHCKSNLSGTPVKQNSGSALVLPGFITIFCFIAFIHFTFFDSETTSQKKQANDKPQNIVRRQILHSTVGCTENDTYETVRSLKSQAVLTALIDEGSCILLEQGTLVTIISSTWSTVELQTTGIASPLWTDITAIGDL